MSAYSTEVEFWFDPVCPYSWTASRWLHEVGRHRRLCVRHRVMSLYLLNEHRTDVTPDYRSTVEASRGPARVAAAAATRFGEEVLAGFYTAFGELVFDVWRRPSAREYREVLEVALPRAGLPSDLADAMESDAYDPAMRASHEAAGSVPRSSPEEEQMTTLTPAQADEVWAGVDDQRARTARLLDGLSAGQWDHASLCEGWTVRHVAAHLTMQQQSYGDLFGFMARHPRMWRALTLNATIRVSALIRARELSTTQIVEALRATIGSRRHNTFVTPLETLTDVLVHSQDIAVPLGLDLELRPGPCALAATRRWEMRGTWMARVNRRMPLDDLRLRATDTDWECGHGAPVEGPIGAILLLLTGRPTALASLTGAGAESLRAQLGSQHSSPSER